MREKPIMEIVVAAVLVVLLVALVNPFSLWMPGMMVAGIVGALFMAFALFAGFVWRERPRDERDALHRLIGDRAAFLAGASVLLAALAFQEYAGAPDPWIASALGTMIIAKAAGIAYGRSRQ